MKLLIDMNLSPRWIDYLAAADIEAVHWMSIGAVNALDIDIMAHAVANDFTVFTHDLDFSAILAATKGLKPSVIQVRGDNLSPESLGTIVINALGLCHNELTTGALVTIDSKRMRLRILPL